MSEEEEEEGDEVGEDDVETEADLLEGDIAVAEVTYRQPCNAFIFGQLLALQRENSFENHQPLLQFVKQSQLLQG